jgi:hypothetical protein
VRSIWSSRCACNRQRSPHAEGAPPAGPLHTEGDTDRITIAIPDGQEYAALVAEFNAARDAELLERTPAFLDEITTETARGRAGDDEAEVEESEADLDRFRTWLAKIAARDFDSPGRAAADAAVAGCARALAESAETGADHATAPLSTL